MGGVKGSDFGKISVNQDEVACFSVYFVDLAQF
jgi:hypothetical protein